MQLSFTLYQASVVISHIHAGKPIYAERFMQRKITHARTVIQNHRIINQMLCPRVFVAHESVK